MNTPKYNSEDFANDTPPRVFGSETEYTSQCLSNGLSFKGNLNDFVPHHLFVSHGRHPHNASAVLKNGAELYFEMSSLPEYATAECLSPKEVLMQERVGELVVAATTQSIAMAYETEAATFKRTGYAKRDRLHDRDIGLNQMSTGHHENYYSFLNAGDEIDSTDEAYWAMTSYLATRPLWAGSGMVTFNGYSVTQKLGSIGYEAPGALTSEGKKPPFRLHDERVEIRSGDGNMSDWAIMQKYGLTSLVLRLVEHDAFPENLILAYPRMTATDVALDPYTNVLLANGDVIRAIDHQRGIITAAYEMFIGTLPDYEEIAFFEFEKFYQDFNDTSLVENDVTKIADRVDWAAKFKWFNQKGILLSDMTNRDLKQVMYDLKWEQIGENNRTQAWYRKFGKQIVSPDVIQANIHFIPNTRAKGRVENAKILYDYGHLGDLDWDVVHDLDGDRYQFPNPFDTYTSHPGAK